MSKIAVSGTTAYDTILLSGDNLSKGLINKDNGSLESSYIINSVNEQIGGTALNICYNLSILNQESKIFTAVGNDFIFPSKFDKILDKSSVYFSDKNKTAKSFITTDLSGTNYNGFYLGAILDSEKVSSNSKENFDYAIVSANGVKSMLKKLKDFSSSGAKVFFDPGQQLIQMTKKDLIDAVKYSNFLIVNKIEFDLFKKISELSDAEMIESFEKIIITYGIKGSKIFDSNYNLEEIEGVENPNALDSTGCGDSYRAGILYGLSNGYGWLESTRLGAIMASVCSGKIGSQNHNLDKDLLLKLYFDTFGEEI